MYDLILNLVQPRDSLCFCLYPEPQKVIGIIVNVSFTALNFMIFVKNARGGREVNMINSLSKINLDGREGGQPQFG